jgi:hypothetical protein
MKKRLIACLVACVLTIPQASYGKDEPVPQLFPGTNVSLETLDLFGVFYHRQAHSPEIRQFSDLSIVKLVPALEKTEQTESDFNTFILDATQGVVLYTLGLKGMGADTVPRFRGASRLVALSNGRLAVILGDSSVDLCSSFNGDSIQSLAGCKPMPVNAVSLTASGTDDVVILTKDGGLQVVDSITGEQEQLDVTLSGINGLHSDGETFAFIYNGGRAVATFRNLGGNCFKEWESWRSCQRANPSGNACIDSKRAFQNCKKGNPGNHTVRFRLVLDTSVESVSIPFADGTSSSPLVLSGLARNQDGRYYALSSENGSMVLLGGNLEPAAVVMAFPPHPRPFRRVSTAIGVRMVPASRLVHVFSTKAIETFSETEYTQADLFRRTPAELIPIYAAIDEIPIESFEADPAQDIMARPEIIEKILQAIGNLRLR